MTVSCAYTRGLLAAALLVLPFLGGCERKNVSPGATTLQHIQKEKRVRIGYANEAPYAYMDAKTNKVTGEAPEIARVILAKLGVEKVEGVLTEFGALIPGLQAGRFDIIAAGMYIKPERCREIAFSNPTYGIGEGLIVRDGNPKQLQSYAGIATDPTATLAVVSGSVERGYARESRIPDERILVFPDAPSAVEAVKAGRADAYGGTSLTVQDLADKARGTGVVRALPFTDPEIKGVAVRGHGAFGFRKSDTMLREAFNRELAAFIGSPEHAAIVRPFGFTETELPGEVTAEGLCAEQ